MTENCPVSFVRFVRRFTYVKIFPQAMYHPEIHIASIAKMSIKKKIIKALLAVLYFSFFYLILYISIYVETAF
jgi:hypothetical protein